MRFFFLYLKYQNNVVCLTLQWTKPILYIKQNYNNFIQQTFNKIASNPHSSPIYSFHLPSATIWVPVVLSVSVSGKDADGSLAARNTKSVMVWFVTQTICNVSSSFCCAAYIFFHTVSRDDRFHLKTTTASDYALN